MKPKLTKAQLAKAKRAMVDEIGRWLLTRANHVGPNDGLVFREDAEWPEVERLLRVALKAVRGA